MMQQFLKKKRQVLNVYTTPSPSKEYVVKPNPTKAFFPKAPCYRLEVTTLSEQKPILNVEEEAQCRGRSN